MTINYKEKTTHLHEAINEAGHTLYRRDGKWVSSDDKAVQKIIDEFDPLPIVKDLALKKLVKEFNMLVSDIEDIYPDAEKRTFIIQAAEARSYLLDSSAHVPTIDALAKARGVTVDDMANRINAKAVKYTEKVNTLIGLRQAKKDEVNTQTDFNLIQKISLISG